MCLHRVAGLEQRLQIAENPSSPPCPRARERRPHRPLTSAAVVPVQIQARSRREPPTGHRVHESVRYGWHQRPLGSTSVARPGVSSPHYFANVRRALRYFLAALAATFKARSVFGSYGVSRMPRSVSTARTRSPASSRSRSAMSFGRVALTDPPACRRVTSFVMVAW